VNYAFVNTQPVTFVIESSVPDSTGTLEIQVRYKQNIRLAETELIFPTSATDTKRHTLNLKGFYPIEYYRVSGTNDNWQLKYKGTGKK
jgi:hypothetical protein